MPPANSLEFKMGMIEAIEYSTSGKSRSSWSRKKRSSNGKSKAEVDKAEYAVHSEKDRIVKRKVMDNAEVLSKMSKTVEGSMVH